MKELSIEQKAKRYDEILARAVGANLPYYNDAIMSKVKEFVEYLLPELKESEDERTWIINYLSNRILNSTIIAEKENLKKAIAWLEKQGEQKPTIEMITPEESLGIDSDTYNKIVDECIYGEQKPAGSEEDEKMLSDIVKDLVHPWNEYIPDRIEDEIKWLKNRLKSLRPQSTWKPSELQIEALVSAIDVMIDNRGAGDKNTILLSGLYHKLKELR